MWIIEKQGATLVLNLDGQRIVFHPATAGTWICATSGGLKLERSGNLMILNTTQAQLIAYPLTNGQWLLSGSGGPGPGPDPGEGEFSWPYEPSPGHWVTSEYGPRSGRFHEGIDFSGGPAVFGQPIPAIGDGTVQQSGSNGAFGWSVIINHGEFDGWSWRSLYAHMPESAPRPAVGATVSKGDIIGLVNNTGSSFGSHLHMETHKVPIGGSMRWDNLNPSYSSPRTAINPRDFFTVYGDGTWILS